MGLFAPPDLFAAVAVGARGDADLPDGVHLRLMPSPALGFPIAPFAIFRVVPFVTEPQVLWRDRAGKVLGEPALDAAGGVLIADIARPPLEEDSLDVAVELVTDGPFDGSLALIDRVGNRLFAERSRPPFIVGGPRVERVRIRGRGRVVGLRTWRVDLQRAFEPVIGQEPVALLSLPIDGSRPWYAKGLGPAASFDQVKRGAALRLQQPDRPDGPFDALTPSDDLARVGIHAPDLDKQCEEMVGHIDVFPRAQRRKETKPAAGGQRQHLVDLGIADTLMVHAMDPGLGRYLGLLGTIDERSDGSQPLAYVAASLFVYSSAGKAPDGRTIDGSLGPRPSVLDRIEERLIERLGAREVLTKLGEKYADVPIFVARAPHLVSRGLLAIAGAVPPPDPPQLSAPGLGDAQWLKSDDGPSDAFRQEFVFAAPPLGALVALGRLEDGLWTTRHRTIDLPPPANPSRRALAMFLGRSQPTPRVVRFAIAFNSYMRRGVLFDAPIPAGEDPVSYRAALADLFGRFGSPAQFDVAAPARPQPPAPAPQAHLVLDGPDGVGGPDASPGHIDVSIDVPSVAALAAGSLDIAALELSFTGVATILPIPIPPIPAGSTRTIVQRIDLPALGVGGRASGTLTARFVDTAGVKSEVASQVIAYGDRRQPVIVPTGLGLIWTSKPGPAPDVELKLRWPASPDTRYRVYVADQKGLGITGASRAEVAVEGGQRDRAHLLGGRDRFRLITEPPLEAVGGSVALNERLPRSLTTVQFLRVVPLSPQGREADFDSCGVVPVAVPSDRTPPPPRVSVAVDPESGIATLTVTAPGLDLVELKAAEPGLFTEPADPAAVPPEFRLRRASGLVNDPVYAREIARGPLEVTHDGDAIVFTAQVADPVALKTFIRYSYWAEVRMPPERRLARVVEIPPPGGVAPIIPAQIADMPRAFSAMSPPATVLRLPPAPVPTLEGAAATAIVEAATVRASLTSASTPAAPPGAIAPYRIRIWEQWGNLAITSSGPDIELDGSPLSWEGTAAPDDAKRPRPLKIHYVVIDPVGRESPLTPV